MSVHKTNDVLIFAKTQQSNNSPMSNVNAKYKMLNLNIKKIIIEESNHDLQIKIHIESWIWRILTPLVSPHRSPFIVVRRFLCAAVA